MTALVLVTALLVGSSAPQAEVIRPDPEIRAARIAAVTPNWPWDALADCESDNRWDYGARPGEGPYHGGLQFLPSTYSAYARQALGDAAPREAWMAPPDQQIAVARAVLADQGWAAWPSCAARLGLR